MFGRPKLKVFLVSFEAVAEGFSIEEVDCRSSVFAFV